MPNTLTIIGLGHLSTSLLTGWEHESPWDHVTGIDHHAEKRDKAKALGVQILSTECDNNEVKSSWLMLAVRPKQIIPTLSKLKLKPQTKIISLAAGITCSSLQQAQINNPVYRAMCNRQCALNEGISILFGDKDPEDRLQLEKAFRALGETSWCSKEAQLDATTAIIGSFPAAILSMIHTIEQLLIQEGFDEPEARTLARQTFYGASLDAKWTHGDLLPEIKKIKVPGGTTEAMLNTLQALNLPDILSKGVLSAIHKSRVLAQESQAPS